MALVNAVIAAVRAAAFVAAVSTIFVLRSDCKRDLARAPFSRLMI